MKRPPRTLQGPWPELLKRLPASALLVLLCYQLQWTWLRFITSEAALRFAVWRGYAAERLSPDVIAWNGHRFQFGISCTFADVFCGAVPLLWVRGAGAPRNGLLLAAFAAALFAFNLLRNATVDLAFSAGVPWGIADQGIAAIAYLAVWIFLVRWVERTSSTIPATTPTASATSE